MQNAKFESAHSINDDIYFRPMCRHQAMYGIADEEKTGRVVAVRFTELKVFYDILCPYHGIIYDNVDSCKVSSQERFGSLEVDDSGDLK